mmetsp:Transcript_17717/g.36113  ORF Transcript_17717/g.36113 Transcript_17717/m.36113 type:complete len:81 (-) Transcript_17717:40-282(-)
MQQRRLKKLQRNQQKEWPEWLSLNRKREPRQMQDKPVVVSFHEISSPPLLVCVFVHIRVHHLLTCMKNSFMSSVKSSVER